MQFRTPRQAIAFVLQRGALTVGQKDQLGNPPDDATMAVLRRDLVDVLRSEEQLGDFAANAEAMTQWEQAITAREASGFASNLSSFEVERRSFRMRLIALPRPQRWLLSSMLGIDKMSADRGDQAGGQ